DPHGLACLEHYVRSRTPAIVDDLDDVVVEMPLCSRAEFCEQVLFAALSARATVVGFNLPFDLSRLAFACAEARYEFAGGFSLSLLTYQKGDVEHDETWRPRVLIHSLDARRARIQLDSRIPHAATHGSSRGRGDFLDLHTLAYALAGESLSLED